MRVFSVRSSYPQRTRLLRRALRRIVAAGSMRPRTTVRSSLKGR